MPVYGYNLDPTNFFWLIGGAVFVVAVLGDFDWKRKLLETHHERTERKARESNKRQQ